MIEKKEYWDAFYKKNGLTREPSSFARYVENKYLLKNTKLLELGCGNGRDSIFFSEKELKISALDLSTQSIISLKNLKINNIDFYNQDFSELSSFEDFDYVYSRFTFHAIDENSENLVLSQLSKTLKVGGLFLLEARSLKDKKLSKYYGKSHFRRFLDVKKVAEKITNNGFTILEQVESQGLSPFKNEDPFLLRIIAKYNGF